MMRLSPAGVALLEHYEGCVLYPYDDADPTWPRRRLKKGAPCRGNPTIGIGHVILPHEDDLWRDIARQEAEALLRKDLAPRESDVNRHVLVDLNEHQFDALVIFTYNVGVGAFSTSSLLKAVNQRRFADCPPLFALFNKWTVDGVKKVNPGLVIRRAKEAALFMQPIPEALAEGAIDADEVLASVLATSRRLLDEVLAFRFKPPKSDPPPEA